jgi:hypothetical protein
MLTRQHVRHEHKITPKTNPLTSVVVREHANGQVTPIAAGYTAGGVPYPAHPVGVPFRPLPGGFSVLSLGRGIVPRGPVVDAAGTRQPGGVGTDLTDPGTWQRPYYFPGGDPPIVPKLHFS